MNYTAKLRKTPPPAAAATVNDPMVLDEGGALAAGDRPAPLSEVAGRQLRVERHCGVGFELVLALRPRCCRWWNSRWKWTLSFAFLCLRLSSRLSTCPSLPFLVVLFSARLCLSRSWWNSWWKCQLCCLIPCPSSGLPSRPLILLFLVVEEVLVVVFKAFPRDRTQQRFVEQITSSFQLLTVVEEVLVEVFKASPRDRGSTAVCGAEYVDTPVYGRGGGARGGLLGLSQGQGSTAVYESGQRSAEQNVDIPAPSFRSRRARRTAEQNVDIPVRCSRAHGGLQGSTARGGAQGASWLRSGAAELEARLEAELEELLAISADTGFTPQQQARFDEVLRELRRFQAKMPGKASWLVWTSRNSCHCNYRVLMLFVDRLPWFCGPVLRRCLRRDVVWWCISHS